MERVTVSILIGTLVALVGCRPSSPAAQPARVVSGSMAPRYCGEHWQVECQGCGYSFQIGVEHPPMQMQAVCPKCGAKTAIDDAEIQPGMAVDIQPRNFAADPLKRWEVVAFHEPGDSERIAVKRVVGLPGEQIAIRGGEIYANDQLVRKSFEEFAAVGQLGYALYRPSFDEEAAPERWRASTADSQWKTIDEDTDNWFVCEPSENSQTDWLEYHHFRGSAFATNDDATPKIADDYAYNQGLTRSLNVVRDVMVGAGVKMTREGEFRVRILGGPRPLWVSLLPSENTVSLWRGDKKLTEARAPTLLAKPATIIDVGLVDGQVLVGIDRHVALTYTFDDPDELADADVSLALGNRDLNVSVLLPSVYRDIYYLNPHGRSEDWEMDAPLGADEYFLLGDNAPVSIDGRQYGPIKLGDIIGTVQPRNEEASATPP